MESLKNLNEKVSLNFNLREPHKMSGATNVYAVLKLNGIQHKIAIGCKVNAWCWDAKKQVPKVSQNMTQKDIENNLQVNNVLNDVRMKFFAYLCGGEPINENALKEILSNSNHDMVNKNAVPPRRTKTATKLITEAFNKRYESKKGTEFYRVTESKLKDFFAFLELPNVYDSANTLTQKGVYTYKEYLEEKARKNGKGASSTIIAKVNLLILLINDLAQNPHHNITPLQPIKAKKVVTDKEDEKKRALTHKEVNAVMQADLKGDKKLEMFRDVFVMQLESGVRFSDVMKLFNGEFQTTHQDGNDVLTIKTQKTKHNAFVIVTPTIKELQTKYANGLPYKLTEPSYNAKLKQIFEMANLTQTETYSIDNQGSKEQRKERLCDIISSHWARHTFITNKVLEGWELDKLCYLTAHTSDKMIKRIYTHITEEQKTQIVLKEQNRVLNNQTNESNTSVKELIEKGKQERDNELIRECKDVLMFLGAQYQDIADVNDLDYLIYLVQVKYYKQFEKMGIETLLLKKIYNTNPTFQEKQKALNEVIEKAKERLEKLAEN